MAAEEAPKQLALFEGQRYPNLVVTLGGGEKGYAQDEEGVLEQIAGLRIGEEFSFVVNGIVGSKRHAVKITDDGPERTLTIALKVDKIAEPDTMTMRIVPRAAD